MFILPVKTKLWKLWGHLFTLLLNKRINIKDVFPQLAFSKIKNLYFIL